MPKKSNSRYKRTGALGGDQSGIMRQGFLRAHAMRRAGKKTGYLIHDADTAGVASKKTIDASRLRQNKGLWVGLERQTKDRTQYISAGERNVFLGPKPSALDAIDRHPPSRIGLVTSERKLAGSGLAFHRIPRLDELVVKQFTHDVLEALRLSEKNRAQKARAKIVVKIVEDYVKKHPKATLADLEIHLSRKIFREKIPTTKSSSLFRADARNIARHKLLNNFLANYSAVAAEYNGVVSKFKGFRSLATQEGELPFTVVFNLHGHTVRGTLYVLNGNITVKGPDFHRAINHGKRLGNVKQLFSVLRSSLGRDVSVVPKAVPLLVQLRMNYNDYATNQGYAPMADEFARRIGVRQHPDFVVRFDAFRALGKHRIKLPREMQAAFGKQAITGLELAERAPEVIATNKSAIQGIKDAKNPEQLLELMHSPEIRVRVSGISRAEEQELGGIRAIL
ncbi:MAG: hypothetical protein JW772_03335, partial [Candidatus Diapherotrites archaeon]|nr:hypothetical protein [Candidatus Diapherotrites archaeon]